MAEIQNLEADIVGNLSKKITGKPSIKGRLLAVTGMTAETKLPNAEPLGLKRTLDERFERGEMFRIIKRILSKKSAAATNEEKEVWGERLHAAVEISRDLRHRLDILNRQYYSPEYAQLIGVEVLGERVEIPVCRYSLRDERAMQSDGQIPAPIVIIGGATAGPTVTKGTVEAFALQYPDRDVFVVGHPDSKQSNISKDLPKKLKDQGSLATYAKIIRDVILKLGFENFDLVGLSMGGGIVLQAALDVEFAGRINNLIAISPTSIQNAKDRKKIGLEFAREILHLRTHPKQWLRVPQVQPGYELGSHEGMGLSVSGEIASRKELSADELARIHVQGRVIIGTGDKDAVISCKQTKEETEAANKKRAMDGEKPIEFMQVLGGHHGMGVVSAAGIVAIIRNTSLLPERINVKDLPTTTTQVFVQEDARLRSIANQILK